MLKLSLVLSTVVGLASAQLPPAPEGLTVVDSKHHSGVKISFKEPGICETTPNVKSYAGHVKLPPGYLEDAATDYPVHTFFWFFEAREDPENAPLAIWLNGGPGGSSMMGLLAENGPCLVNSDSATTRLNPWSWNNKVNMLYIDEPTQVGFSYDVPTNCTVDLASDDPRSGPVPADFSDGVPATNLTNLVGTYSSQNSSQTANSTQHAAHALWHFAQVFFSEFPHYKPADDRISLWAESYGGHYGPAFMQFFQQQNEKIRDGTIEQEHAHYLHLDTLGIVNGYMDAVVQNEAYITFPYNNTFGIQVFNQSIYDELMHNFTKPGGCKEQNAACQAKISKERKHNMSASSKQLCDFEEWCITAAEAIYSSQDYGWLDIANPGAEPFPPSYLEGYLTQSSVLQAIGSPVNYTASSGAVSHAFEANFDQFAGGFLEAIAYLLDNGVKVHMMYGDRDYACNWVGGEAASLAVPYSGLKEFSKAGYADMLSGGELKGLTRQHGNYSFTRVFDAGHLVPSYEPQAAYDIFMRALFNTDIATGKQKVTNDYKTEGPDNTWHFQKPAPTRPKPECYVLKPSSCTKEDWELVKSGKALVKDFILQGEEGDDDNEEL